MFYSEKRCDFSIAKSRDSVESHNCVHLKCDNLEVLIFLIPPIIILLQTDLDFC